MNTAYVALLSDGILPRLSEIRWAPRGFLSVSHTATRKVQVIEVYKAFHSIISLTSETTAVPKLAENLAGLLKREKLPQVDRSWREIELQPGDALLFLLPTANFRGSVEKSSNRPVEWFDISPISIAAFGEGSQFSYVSVREVEVVTTRNPLEAQPSNN